MNGISKILARALFIATTATVSLAYPFASFRFNTVSSLSTRLYPNHFAFLVDSDTNRRRFRSAFQLVAVAASKSRKASSIGGGFGKKSEGSGSKKPSASVDVATLLRQSMDLYDKLGQGGIGYSDGSDDEEENLRALEFREYVVCVRHAGESQVCYPLFL